MNKGIAMATGDVVGILNSDDFFASAGILQAVAGKFAESPDLDVVYGDVQYVSWSDTSALRRPLMRLGFMPAHPSFYCRRSTYERFKLDGTVIPGFRGDPSWAYFDTSYKIAADFENLLRMIFVGRIRTCYIEREFVRMRQGGASSSGASSHRQINRDHQRAFKQNGVYSNLLLESLRYVYKVGEVVKGKL